MTQKPDSSRQSSKSVKVWVDASRWRCDRQKGSLRKPGQPAYTKPLRTTVDQLVNQLKRLFTPFLIPTRWRRRIWRIWILAWVLGALTALVPIGIPRLSQSSIPHLWHESLAQTVQSFAPLSLLFQAEPTELPRATEGLTQPSLWSHAATLAAYLGHLPYPKIDPQYLISFPKQASPFPYANRTGESLHPDAATALKTMIDAARLDGVWIVLVSGFRDLATQNRLFEERTEALGSMEKAAQSVAPPGYSEHHTGYAIDITDGSGLGFYAFEQTPAFRWMQVHAHEFGFELSFPPHNPQGIDYEPWHWRFVGSPESARIFAAARGE